MIARIASMVFGALLAVPLTAQVLGHGPPPLWMAIPWGAAMAFCVLLADRRDA